MDKLDTIVERIKEVSNPTSIFLYGSRARDDFLEDSDYEIGVLLPTDNYVTRSSLRDSIGDDQVNAYPFTLEDFENGIVDTPFQTSIYLRDLTSSAKTIYGKQIVEILSPPKITVVDLVRDIGFNIGTALAALRSHRSGDIETANDQFYKSCLFGTRDLELLSGQNFPSSYTEIISGMGQLDLGLHLLVVQNAYSCRISKNKCSERDLFANISYLNGYVEPLITTYLDKYGNENLL